MCLVSVWPHRRRYAMLLDVTSRADWIINLLSIHCRPDAVIYTELDFKVANVTFTSNPLVVMELLSQVIGPLVLLLSFRTPCQSQPTLIWSFQVFECL